MEEVWKPCPGCESYAVSNCGRFKTKTGKINLRKPHTTGYVRVYLPGTGTKALHVLIATAFLPKSDSSVKTVVNHKDGDRQNNHVTNLEWVTPSENSSKKTKKTPISTNLSKNTDLSGEVWVSTVYDGLSLRASTYGRVELPTGYKTYGSPTADGYLSVSINYERTHKRKMHRVHRIVCQAFNNRPLTSDLVVNHKDYNKKNNKPDNLEWVTVSQNNKHGAVNRVTSIHNKQVVYQYTLDKAVLLRKHDSITAAAKATGTNRSSIVQLCSNWKNKNHATAGGYFWSYNKL